MSALCWWFNVGSYHVDKHLLTQLQQRHMHTHMLRLLSPHSALLILTPKQVSRLDGQIDTLWPKPGEHVVDWYTKMCIYCKNGMSLSRTNQGWISELHTNEHRCQRAQILKQTHDSKWHVRARIWEPRATTWEHPHKHERAHGREHSHEYESTNMRQHTYETITKSALCCPQSAAGAPKSAPWALQSAMKSALRIEEVSIQS